MTEKSETIPLVFIISPLYFLIMFFSQILNKYSDMCCFFPRKNKKNPQNIQVSFLLKN